MTKSIRIITTFLGASMFIFGVLKFINPFKGWYTTQIIKSQLPFQQMSYWSGQIGEIIVGVMFIYLSFVHSKINTKHFRPIFYIGNTAIVFMMLTAFYVHLCSNVPADVLPLKVRTPIIPAVILLLSLVNMYLYNKLVNARNS